MEQQCCDYRVREKLMFGRNIDERAGENEKKRPDNVDDTPRRFVMNDTVGHERADTIDGEITQTQVLKTLAKQTEN